MITPEARVIIERLQQDLRSAWAENARLRCFVGPITILLDHEKYREVIVSLRLPPDEIERLLQYVERKKT